jgi:hypothetical protein
MIGSRRGRFGEFHYHTFHASGDLIGQKRSKLPNVPSGDPPHFNLISS